MFSPSLGRFLRPDPIGFEAGDPDLYRFVGNDPTNATDPSGLIGIFFDGTTMTAKENTIIRQIHTEYRKKATAEIYEFKHLGGDPAGWVGWMGTWFSAPGAQVAYATDHAMAAKEFDDNVDAAFRRVMKEREEKKDDPVDIFGYSRGAIAAVYLARKLRDEGVKVRYMGLIDPSVTYSGKNVVPTIPNNVEVAKILYSGPQQMRTIKEFGSDHLLVRPCRLELEKNNKNTKLISARDPTAGHLAVGKSPAVGSFIWPDPEYKLPLSENPFPSANWLELFCRGE